MEKTAKNLLKTGDCFAPLAMTLGTCDLLNLARKVNFSLPGFDKVGATNNEKGQHVSPKPEQLFTARQINKGELSHVQF